MLLEYKKGIEKSQEDANSKGTSNSGKSAAKFRIKDYKKRIEELEEKISKLKEEPIQNKNSLDQKMDEIKKEMGKGGKNIGLFKPKIKTGPVYTSDDLDKLEV